jgi:DNA-binding transcriptional ArsR family regulator
MLQIMQSRAIRDALGADEAPLRAEDGEKTVSELVRETEGFQANVSKHLGVLLDAGFWLAGSRAQAPTTG